MEIYDNGGATFDRYTVVTKAGDIFTMSDNPLSPSGFNQYSHTLNENEEYKMSNNENRIPLTQLPPLVTVAIIQRLEAD